MSRGQGGEKRVERERRKKDEGMEIRRGEAERLMGGWTAGCG